MGNPRLACPICLRGSVHNLETVSRDAAVDYFICTSCMHVWNVPKGANAPVHHVTDPEKAHTNKVIAS
jgi:hypothetical protein